MDVPLEPRENKAPVAVHLQHLRIFVRQPVGARYAQDHDAQGHRGKMTLCFSLLNRPAAVVSPR